MPDFGGFAAQAERWREFYLMAGTAAVTLMGLLFVGLATHLETLVRDDAAHLRTVALEAFLNFAFVLLVSLTMLQPQPTARPIGVELAGIGVARLVLLGRNTRALATLAGHGFSPLHVAQRLLPSVIGNALLLLAGAALTRRPAPGWAMDLLFLVIVLLLLGAVRSAWDLVVRVGQAKYAGGGRRCE